MGRTAEQFKEMSVKEFTQAARKPLGRLGQVLSPARLRFAFRSAFPLVGNTRFLRIRRMQARSVFALQVQLPACLRICCSGRCFLL